MYLNFSIEEVEQKDLFFMLANAFALSDISREMNVTKMAGVYAIYKDGICLYVGQSQNIPSRLATHLRGKYIECDKINIYTPNSFDFSDFYERNSESKKEILLNNEKMLIATLKPVENLLADMDFKIEDRFLFDSVSAALEPENNDTAEYEIIKHNGEIAIFDEEPMRFLEMLGKGRFAHFLEQEAIMRGCFDQSVLLSLDHHDITFERKGVNHG